MSILISVVLFLILLSAIIYVYFKLLFTIENRTKVDVEEIRREITSLMGEFNRISDTNITVLEEKIKAFQEISEYADKKMVELQIIQEQLGRQHQPNPLHLLSPESIPANKPNITRHKSDDESINPTSKVKRKNESPAPKKRNLKKAVPLSKTKPPLDNNRLANSVDGLVTEINDTVQIQLPANFASLSKVEKARVLIRCGYSENDVVKQSGISRTQYSLLKSVNS
jgi:hypothetical protein